MTSSRKHYVTNFYHFTPLEDPYASCKELQSWGQSLNLSGLVIIAQEGLNGTLVSSSAEQRQFVMNWVTNKFNVPQEAFKISESHQPLFPHYKVKVRQEIVTLHTPELVPRHLDDPSYLSPEEWNSWLKSQKKFNLVDARNSYEFGIGAFKGAKNPETRNFTEFPDSVENKLKIPKEDPLLIYCTGGIRCEKATLELRRRGYHKVFQLHGGILRYLEQFPQDQFEGECFVFDERVAVTQDLNPTTRFTLCPHCGDPAEHEIHCHLCHRPMRICRRCQKLPLTSETCSKNCSHHYKRQQNKDCLNKEL